MKRTKLKNRKLPNYTKGEEIFNMVSHIVGGGLGVIIAALCIVKSFLNHDAYQIVGAFIYGFSMIILYTMSSIYHGLIPLTAKKVFQIIDHCAIFVLIAGTYTPIALSAIREYNTALGWCLFGFVWAMSALGITLNAIDLKKYSLFSNICYIALGWCVIFIVNHTIKAISMNGFWWLLSGGIAYTIGAVLYGVAGKWGLKYIHSVFHLFVILGSVLQFVCIILYVLV
ncbi:MAG: hemolysin III family protein [Ruminococcaceae bacterium]|nr:hemolysin III family protein [Oscillospiraceae bacterium]